jgi:hypothetical protein
MLAVSFFKRWIWTALADRALTLRTALVRDQPDLASAYISISTIFLSKN